MIINTGQRTDIPAFYSDWFYQRIKEGYVLVRNPFYPKLVTRYSLLPEDVDLLSFCSKNPTPMLSRLKELSSYRLFFYVSITPYGEDIEPGVRDKRQVIESFRKLSLLLGKEKVSWRYDPILITRKYSLSYHLRAFTRLCELLDGYTDTCVFSFLELYKKTKRNFPLAREVTREEKKDLLSRFVPIARKHHISLLACHEKGKELEDLGIDEEGCFTKERVEKIFHIRLSLPKNFSYARSGCRCILSHDIGAYNTCLHHCLYCYATEDFALALKNHHLHDPSSPLLIGHLEKDDIVKEAKKESYLSQEITLF